MPVTIVMRKLVDACITHSLSLVQYVLDDDPGEDAQQELQKIEEEKQAAAIKALTKRKKMLENEKEIIQQKPALDLMTETKLFREDVFKRRYRASKSVASEAEEDAAERGGDHTAEASLGPDD